MSWSVAGVGKPTALAKSIDGQFANAGVCAEPEEIIRQAARSLLTAALAAQWPDSAVSVVASGSQSATYVDGKWGPPYQNQLNIEVKPLYGFVEES